MKREISHKEIHEIHNFIRGSVNHFKRLNCNPNKIKIGVPSWLEIAILQVYFYELQPFEPITYWRKSFYCGANMQPHFKDEIVVFYEDYYFNDEQLKPKIHEIRFSISK